MENEVPLLEDGTTKEYEEALWSLRTKQDAPNARDSDEGHVCPWTLSPAAEALRQYLADGLEFEDLLDAADALVELAEWLRRVAKVRPFGLTG